MKPELLLFLAVFVLVGTPSRPAQLRRRGLFLSLSLLERREDTRCSSLALIGTASRLCGDK